MACTLFSFFWVLHWWTFQRRLNDAKLSHAVCHGGRSQGGVSVQARARAFKGMRERENPTPCEMRINIVRVKPDLVWLLHCGGSGRRPRHFILVRNAKKKKVYLSQKTSVNRQRKTCCFWYLVRGLRQRLCFFHVHLEGGPSTSILLISTCVMCWKNDKVKQKSAFCFTWLLYPLSWEAARPLGESSSCLWDKMEVNELIIPTTTPTCTAADNLRSR